MKKYLAVTLSLLLMMTCCFGTALGEGTSEMYDYPGESKIIRAVGDYDAALWPNQQLEATFTADAVAVDGQVDAIWQTAAASAIGKTKNISEHIKDPSAPIASGTLRTLWNGPQLFLLIEVQDATVQRGGSPMEGAMTANPAIPSDRDSVCIGVDFFNDKVNYETDTAGVFNISANGELSYFRNAMIPSLGSIFDPIHPEHTFRLGEYAAADLLDENGNVVGYCVEIALQIEGLNPDNGTQIGLDVEICDSAVLNAYSVETLNWFWQPVVTEYPEGPGLAAQVFWSHDQDTLYTDLSHERPNAVDWGDITLTGWDGETAFAASNWRITSTLAHLDSISFAKDVYTAESQARLDEARGQAEAVLNSGDAAQLQAAADALEQAVDGLRWADTKYPDPDEYEDQMTLPNPYQFFGSDRMVSSSEDWAERRAEILDLAQFYEYGYKPGAPDKMEIVSIQHFDVGAETGMGWFGPTYAACAQDKVVVSVTVGENTVEFDYTVFQPTAEQLAAAGHTDGPVPVVLSYGGDIEAYRQAGFVVVSIPAVASDTRTNEYAWGERTDAFYKLYPYARNGEGALKEVSVTMAQAWAATRVIDCLEMMAECEVEGAKDIAAAFDASRLAVTGFSYQGKYAFVAAVYDERIDVCIPGAAGASGPSPWRYVYHGQEYDFTGTAYAPADGSAATLVAFGTETIGNSVRHNRVRETELFRQFLNLGHIYAKLPGAYGFGTRLPYDQEELTATLAPRAIVLENTVNDFNDGSVADALSMTLAKSVYRNLGYDADDLVVYNYRPIVTQGDPHGSDDLQRQRTAAYLEHYFYGTPLAEDVKELLTTDPFSLPVSNGQKDTPYDYYWGGLNTITGGTEGIDGTDGWYFYQFEKE